ncbi:hypothetical protein SDC9_111832 [bioreactor metagenome]|uniref:Uncharacterized protein n=1 Tax=bioreactor metagenome TaxID=1076179 RepID=A0A645BHJ1_9ZZZZ
MELSEEERIAIETELMKYATDINDVMIMFVPKQMGSSSRLW